MHDSDAPSETLYSDPWITVDTVPAQRGDGTTYPHRRIISGTGFGAIVIPRTVNRGLAYIALVSQSRPAPGIEMSLELPRGGTIDLSRDEAMRELIEETGLQDAGLYLLGVIRPDTGLMNTSVGVWLAGIPAASAHLDESRSEWESGATCRWMMEADAYGAVRSGKITCGMTIAALGMLRMSHLATAPISTAAPDMSLRR